MRSVPTTSFGRMPGRLSGLLLGILLVLGTGCATMGASDDPTAALNAPDVTRRTTAAGEVVEEYRIAGQLHVVKITPPRGPTYYLVDSDGDGTLDSSKGEGPITPVQYKLFEWD